MARKWCILWLLKYIILSLILSLSGGEIFNKRDNLNQFADSVAAVGLEWYRFIYKQHKQQQQQNTARQLQETQNKNPKLDSIFEIGNGFKLFNGTMDTGKSNNNNNTKNNTRTKSNEEPFKKDMNVQDEQQPIEQEQLVILDALANGYQTLKCANSTGKNFCEKVINYPDLTQFDKALSQDLFKFSAFFNVEEVMLENFEGRISGNPHEEFLCKSKKSIVYPEAGETKNSNWLFIVNNYKELRQGVLVEQCRNEGAACDIIGALPLQYTSYCKQEYSYRPLVAFLNGTFVREYFRMPSCCKCAIVQMPTAQHSEFGGF